ncbi:MAG: hypothetical protein IKX23_10630 [Treponema sp.]|nr:hypothetical protein [Treponema sp.]
MKILNKKSILSLAVIAALFCSCESSKVEQASTPDSYNDESSAAVQTQAEESSDSGKKAETSTKIVTKESKKSVFKNPFGDFTSFGNKDDYIKYETGSVFSKEVMGNLKEKETEILIRKDNYMTGFESSYMSGYYIIQFNENARKKLAEAVDLYLSDFENKRLDRKGSQTAKKYGKISYQLNWGTIKSSTPNNGRGTGYLGYEFVNGSPYFTISNFAFINDYYKIAGEATSRESLAVKYYFTKAQITHLVECMTDDVIRERIAELQPSAGVTEAADEY